MASAGEEAAATLELEGNYEIGGNDEK